MSDTEFAEVRMILDSELESFEDEEAENLYDKVERYAETADAMDSAGRDDDAEYFRELAVEAYDSFCMTMQLKKGDEEL